MCREAPVGNGRAMVRFGQKTSGIWFMEYEDLHGARRRISTGIKTEKLRKPPPDVKAKVQEVLFPIWKVELLEYKRRKAAELDEALREAQNSSA